MSARFNRLIAEMLLAAAVLFSAGCPAGENGNGAGDDKQNQQPVVLSLVVQPESAGADNAKSAIAAAFPHRAASELKDGYAKLLRSGRVAGALIEIASLDDEDSTKKLPASGYILLSPQFPPESAVRLAARVKDSKARLIAFSDEPFAADDSLLAVSFDYTALGFVGGAFVAQMTKAGNVAVLVSKEGYRGRALASGVEQGARWARGGAKVGAFRFDASDTAGVAGAVQSFFLSGGEFLVFDSDAFGDAPVRTARSLGAVVLALGADENSAGAGACLTSYVTDYGAALGALVSHLKSGDTGSDGVLMLGLADGVFRDTGFDDYKRHRRVDETVLKYVADVKDQITTGEIPLARPARDKASKE